MADLTKPSNITTGGQIKATDSGDLYDILLGTSNYDNLAPNGIKIWAGMLSQSGTSAPTATVIYNSLGGTVVWTRVGTGIYRGTLVDAFTSSKTICLNNHAIPEQGGVVLANIYRGNINYVTLYTYDSSIAEKDVFSGLTILILVFP